MILQCWLKSFITTQYGFEKQWLSSLAPQKFICFVKERDETSNEKNAKTQTLIWQLKKVCVK